MVVVRNGLIHALLPANELDRAHYPDVVELPAHALIPGLINAHTHSPMVLLRGLADDLPLMRWLEDHIWPAEQDWAGPDFVREGTELAMAEMLRGGTTCFSDMYFFPEVTAASAIRVGMRAVIGLPVINVPTAWAGSEEEYFERGLIVHDELLREPLVRTAFAPHAPYTVSDEGFRRIARLAEELDVPVHLHLLEAPDEIESSRKRFGMHPLDRLDRFGLLGARLLAVHMIQLTNADMDRIARTGVHVIHCPESNLKLASGICPVAELDARGVNVAIGTDGAASNNDLDMFGELRLAALLAKGASGNPEAVPAARALSMATLNGARALGMEEETGSIEIGKQADLAAVRLDGPESMPMHNVISQLVYATARSQVTEVWVGGRRVVSDGRVTAMDTEQVSTRAQRWTHKLQAPNEQG